MNPALRISTLGAKARLYFSRGAVLLKPRFSKRSKQLSFVGQGVKTSQNLPLPTF